MLHSGNADGVMAYHQSCSFVIASTVGVYIINISPPVVITFLCRLEKSLFSFLYFLYVLTVFFCSFFWAFFFFDIIIIIIIIITGLFPLVLSYILFSLSIVSSFFIYKLRKLLVISWNNWFHSFTVTYICPLFFVIFLPCKQKHVVEKTHYYSQITHNSMVITSQLWPDVHNSHWHSGLRVPTK